MSILQTFLQRAHRRRLIWRVIEYAGVGLLFGCAVCLVLILALWWRGDDAVVACTAILVISCVAGMVASARNIPSLLDTAMLAESHLKSPQLLSSALLIDHRDQFANAVIALADARVRGISPSVIVTRKLSARSWNAIALAVSFVLVGAAITSPRNSFANRGELARVDDEPWTAKSATSSTSSKEPESDHVARESDSFGADRSSSSESESGRERNGSSTNAGGGGSSRTDQAAKSIPESSVKSTPSSVGEIATAGSGDAIRTSNEATGTSGEVNSSAHLHAAPWTSASWPADRDSAMKSLQAGSIPDRYRDLVRDYFDRD